MSTIITPYIIRQIEGKKFKGKTREKQELIKRAGQKGISHWQMDRELEDLGYEKKDRKKIVKLMRDLADKRKQKNIKVSRRLSRVIDSKQGENSEEQTYFHRKFARESSESKRDIALKKIRQGGQASVKSDLNLINKEHTSALSKGKNKKGFANKTEKKTGFASSSQKPSNLTKTGGSITSGTNSSGRMKL